MLFINISAPKTNILNYDRELIEKKLKELEKYTRYFKRDLKLEVNVSKTVNASSGEIYFAEARLFIPGKDLTCKVNANNFKELAVLLKDNLKRLIIEHKKTKESFFKRAARKLKEKLIWRYLKP